ncbi:phage recombination protein Bet [Aerococcus kribbianus]|uniref:Phage recombination protein Bet n=1 Tax=Aerococcus kribbianus TaxID=2999064 RepID=A0A9X3FQH2_9LACT|nr:MULTISPECIES: phage recombination protein Bet [unclassified Aerococcus]MCZ0717854.1 phage recombination protein Bet [Aerococcus sp. YH-aer221]MCZ0726141.1 phage recombination protein Bet [Aerococcus sp. YH-aer222]
MANNEIMYKSGNEDIKLSVDVVSQFITKGNGAITTSEAFNFMQLCRYNSLNPFLGEAYIIKFGNQPADMIVSKDAFMKRAERQPAYKGFDAGVVVADKDGEIKERPGTIFIKGKEELLGGWAKVYREDRDIATYVSINFDEFAKRKKDGQLQATWASMPANMIRKSAVVNALREAFPDQLSAMYTEEDNRPKQDVTGTVVEEEQDTSEGNQLLEKLNSKKEQKESVDDEKIDEPTEETQSQEEKETEGETSESDEVNTEEQQDSKSKGNNIGKAVNADAE